MKENMVASFKEKYWKYSLIAIIIFLGIIIFREFSPFFSGLLGAFTIYVLVRKQMFYLTEKKKIKKIYAVLIILIEVIMCIIVPTFLLIWLLLGRLKEFDIHPAALFQTVQNFVDLIHSKTDYDLLSQTNVTNLTGYISDLLQTVLGQVSSFVINSVVLLFILYFMLMSNRQMESYVYELLPFNEKNKRNVITEIKRMVTSNAIGIPLLAIIQGAVATIGYIIFDVPTPYLFGVLTCFATIIPVVGTAMVWFPLAVFLALSGNWFGAIGLAIYSLVIISNVDNLIRFLLQKKMADTHPLITVFGVLIGLTLFGFWGVIFGPLLLSMFFLLIRIFKAKYLESKDEFLKTD